MRRRDFIKGFGKAAVAVAGASTMGCGHIAMQTAYSKITGNYVPIPGKGGRKARSLTFFHDPDHTHYTMIYSNPSDEVHEREIKRDKVGKDSYDLKVIEYDLNHSLKRTIYSHAYPGARFHKNDVRIVWSDGREEEMNHLPEGLSDKIFVIPNFRK
jgi:hypothetical protein